MPALSADEYAALKVDIAARGVKVPVEYDELENILDGHHRVQICQELGISQWPRLVRHGLSEDEKRRHARRLNLDRRHLDQEQKRALIAAELREHPEVSNRAIGKALNVDGKTVGSVRSDLESTAEIPQLSERKGRDDRVRRITQFVPSNPQEEKGIQLSAKALNARNDESQRLARRDIAKNLSDTSHELTGERSFPCVYLDPAYKRKAGIGNRAYENHYRTETWADIIAIMERVAPRLQQNAWGFIWIPRAHMLALHPVKYAVVIDDGSKHDVEIKTPLIWAIALALGMDAYSTCFVWTKTDEEHEDEIGTGLVVRDQDEILCLFKKGAGLPKPAGDEKFGSNHRERSRPLGHSRKPQFYREMIATMTGGVPVLELFARIDPDHPLPENWEAWGNEASPEAEPRPPEPLTVPPLATAPKATRPELTKWDVLDIPDFLKRGPDNIAPFATVQP
jgi:ParB-like chromosome segregation protein Spo0J